jgi:60 kDa SS-A/Ro ribonucleoprotein
MDYTRHFQTRKNPQSEPIPGEKQVENNAGGFVYEVTPFQRLQRFLVLGCEGGTYYQGESKLTKENGQNVFDCLQAVCLSPYFC